MSKIPMKDYMALDSTGVSAIGNIKNKKGFQRVKIKLEYLREAVEMLENQKEDEVVIYSKTNHPIMFGRDNIGIIIAPLVPR